MLMNARCSETHAKRENVPTHLVATNANVIWDIRAQEAARCPSVLVGIRFSSFLKSVFQYFLQYLMPECIGRYSFQQLFEIRVSIFSAIFDVDARGYW